MKDEPVEETNNSSNMEIGFVKTKNSIVVSDDNDSQERKGASLDSATSDGVCPVQSNSMASKIPTRLKKSRSSTFLVI